MDVTDLSKWSAISSKVAPSNTPKIHLFQSGKGGGNIPPPLHAKKALAVRMNPPMPRAMRVPPFPRERLTRVE